MHSFGHKRTKISLCCINASQRFLDFITSATLMPPTSSFNFLLFFKLLTDSLLYRKTVHGSAFCEIQRHKTCSYRYKQAAKLWSIFDWYVQTLFKDPKVDKSDISIRTMILVFLQGLKLMTFLGSHSSDGR
ncbi:PREDICTED: uncharacterized protein LOC104599245 [Nelumbo nucifera]|uniref:Uncharacterized protein LOC104599245 n=1 Tax=Nelumbo nucifera TaxID=4432 RepID=A0A1U8Q476_NELNU|nr:PREDICTED: uncharacterized protein LOC104599245 [Nelumbo nucifera]